MTVTILSKIYVTKVLFAPTKVGERVFSPTLVYFLIMIYSNSLIIIIYTFFSSSITDIIVCFIIVGVLVQ